MSVGETRASELGAWSPTVAGEPFGEWEIPGMGEPGPRCGEISAAAFCDEHGHIDYRCHLCGRRDCPGCWSAQWAAPRTVSVVSRLAAARYAEEDGLDRRMVHAVASPPEDSINTIRGFYEGRRDALDLAREHGVRGGVVVAHGYRVLKDVKAEYRELDPDLPLWRWIRSNDRDWREQVYWSPHYHIIGLSRDTKPGDDDADDGWVFTKIRSLRPFEGARDREAYNDMAGTIRYLLSHATFPAEENRQAVTWYGSVHGTNFNPEEALSEGAWSLIQRVAEEVVGHEVEDDEEGGRQEAERCPVDDCEGRLHDIWGARMFLDSAAGQELTRDERERVRAAYEWAAGIRQPPPGLQRPKTVEHAEDVIEHFTAEGL